MADPFAPPPAAREWLAACIMSYIEHEPPEEASRVDGRIYRLLGALEHHAMLTPEQAGKLNHWLLPTVYDEQGERIDREPGDG